MHLGFEVKTKKERELRGAYQNVSSKTQWQIIWYLGGVLGFNIWIIYCFRSATCEIMFSCSAANQIIVFNENQNLLFFLKNTKHPSLDVRWSALKNHRYYFPDYRRSMNSVSSVLRTNILIKKKGIFKLQLIDRNQEIAR